MYPDEEMLSAYIDGELSESERREVESALSDDDTARAHFEQLRAVKRALGSAFAEETDSEEWAVAAHSRVWNRLQVQTLASEEPRGFSRTIRVPVPAVVAFAACFVMLGAALLAISIRDRQQSSSIEAISAARDAPITINVDSQDTDKLLRWLSSNEMLGQVNVQLPSRPQFEIIGDPVLMPVSEYRSNAGGGSRGP